MRPKTGMLVNGVKGVEVRGAGCGMRTGETAWLFDQDLFDNNYYLVYDPNTGPRPVLSQDGDFVMDDSPIGDPGDKRKRYIIALVLASPECGKSILRKQVDGSGNYVFSKLPAGCRSIDQVQILESQ